ncbi:hypothetical protein [Halomonas binhaiensis]|uniref:Uncharacterized protein n=1 Tax=Halomonas binhaiensis TaxID=2562282 RepID=A0A856QQA9_9GAMM|nr:hypothetical protein [Halomonas binhaiensis]QEM82118.2 hypothetical protein E4T21_11585 [Halomonas binhaiensis]
MTEPSDRADFEAQLDEYRQHNEFSELPGLDVSMWSEDVVFHDDLSEVRYYNPIFIDHRIDNPSRFRFLMVILFFFHNVSLLTLLWGLFTGKDFSFGEVLFLMICPAFAWVLFLAEWFGARTGGVRFNRQAQMVHIGQVGGAISVPWKSVKPFFNHGVHGGDLRLFFPWPNVMIKHDGTKENFRYKDDKKPLTIYGAMDWRDTGIDGSLLRLEFYRRFMEEGFEAVQPNPEKVETSAIRPPSEVQQSQPEHGVLLHWILTPIAKLGSILAGGPLIDSFLRKQAQKFKWPEEIERLCSPGADLSGIDTTPVKPRKDIFYRPCGLDGIELVNARGQRIG